MNYFSDRLKISFEKRNSLFQIISDTEEEARLLGEQKATLQQKYEKLLLCHQKEDADFEWEESIHSLCEERYADLQNRFDQLAIDSEEAEDKGLGFFRSFFLISVVLLLQTEILKLQGRELKSSRIPPPPPQPSKIPTMPLGPYEIILIFFFLTFFFRYAEAFYSLVEMGFTDENKVRALLIKHKGSTDAVLTELLHTAH